MDYEGNFINLLYDFMKERRKMYEKFKKRRDFGGGGVDSAKSIEKEFKFHSA